MTNTIQTQVQALVFDVFGTVVDWRSGVTEAIRDLVQQHDLPGIDPAAFADAWRSHYVPSMAEVRSGRRPFTRLDILHRENLEKTLAQFQVDTAGLSSETLDNLNLVWHRLDPWPDSLAGLTQLKSGYIIAPLSNGNIRLMLDMAKRAGLPWDAILGAETASAYKPAPEAYLRTAEILALAPEQICMVAAHNGDLAAARSCGFRTAFIARPIEHGPEQKTDLVAEQDWDVVAKDMIDLANQIAPQ